MVIERISLILQHRGTIAMAALLLYSAAIEARARLTQKDKNVVVAELSKNLFHPETAIFRFKTYHREKGFDFVCGTLKAQDGNGKYVGEKKFYALLNGGAVIRSGILEMHEELEVNRRNAARLEAYYCKRDRRR